MKYRYMVVLRGSNLPIPSVSMQAYINRSRGGQGTSWMIFWVAGVWGVYRILPISRGLMACHIIRDMGLESMLLMRLLQKGAGGGDTGA